MCPESPEKNASPDGESSDKGPRLGGSVFPVSRERPVELGRYSVVGILGKGGMGVVYEAIDRERGQVVALKTLRKLDPYGLRRLKAEFRSVADVVHPNLVLLFELVADDDDLFFTMEYVAGEGFLDHVRGPGAVTRPLGRPASRAMTVPDAVARSESEDDESAPPLDPTGIERLKRSTVHVVSGLAALHRAGKFHRDVKPSNVRVTPQGRAVVLDFGLVKGDVGADLYGPTAGTPSYMAPEQVLGERVTAATDLYAVGVMMYEALVGRKPFTGAAPFVLASKVHAVPERPRALVATIPEDLDALCMDLLAASPDARPSSAEVVRRLGGSLDASTGITGDVPPSARGDAPSSSRKVSGSGSKPTPSGSSTAPLAPFGFLPQAERSPGSSRSTGSVLGPVSGGTPAVALVGREREVEVLFAAYEATKRGESVAVAVSGLSGVGKSSVVRGFLDGLRAGGEAVILEGRCYERESVRFKAFDDIVDALGQVLRHMPWQARLDLLPKGIAELSRIFPVLSDLAVAAGVEQGDAAPDPVELQRRAFGCLKGLLVRLARKKPLVLYVDDLQWGDSDSGRLLVELLSPPERPALLLVYTYRREEAAASPLLADLSRHDLGETLRDLQIAPLSFEQSCDLGRVLFGASEEAASNDLVEAIGRESEGNPFFVEQLVRHVSAGGALEVSLADLVAARLSVLSDDARRTLEVVAIAGRPLEQGIAERAARLTRDDRASIPMLRAQGLVRTRGARHRDTIEPYHDRVREHVTASLAEPTRRAHHLAIAEALEATGRADAHDLALHFHGAGDLPRAYRHALRAAEHEAQGLAFDRAAELFALALECAPRGAEGLVAVRIRLAETLVCAGRSGDAAPHYFAAAERSVGPRANDLRRLGAEQLLVSGRIDEGVAAFRPVLEQVGLSYPSSPRRALVATVARAAALELRGTKAVVRAPEEISARDLAQVDVAWSAGKGLLAVDSIRGGYFFIRTVEASLRAGEPLRIARSLGLYGMMVVYGGERRAEIRGMATLERAIAMAEELGDPTVLGTVRNCLGTAYMSVCKWREGLKWMDSGIAMLESRTVGTNWEVAVCTSSCFNTRIWLGTFADIARLAPVWSRKAERTGDGFSWVQAEHYVALADLARDEPAMARARLARTMEKWTENGFHFQHWLALKLNVWCDLYEGRSEEAYTRLARAFPMYEGSGLSRILLMRLDAHLLRATVAIAASRGREHRLDDALRDAERIRSEGRATADGAAALVRALVSSWRGERTRARTDFTIAARELGQTDVRLYAAAARIVREPSGPEDLEARDASRQLLASEGIVRPDAFLRVLVPMP